MPETRLNEPISRAGAPEAAQLRQAITTQSLSTLAAWEELAQDWLLLWARTRGAMPFQRPEWLLSWWRHLGGGELVVATARQAGRLVALAPFFRYDQDGRRRLLPVGIGVTDRLDPLVAEECASEAAAAVLHCLAECARDGESLELHELSEESPLLHAPPPVGWSSAIVDESVSPALSLPKPPVGLDQLVPKKTMRDLRTAQRRCRSAGAVTFEAADATSWAGLLESLFALHGERWRQRGESGVLSDPAVRDFHRTAARAFAEAGLLRLYGLRLADRIVAAFYGFAGEDRLYAYLTAFDPTCERLSVGAVLLGHAIEEAIRDGLGTFDMLRGREAYKYAWGATDRPGFCRMLTTGLS